jgi:hypothetical protein
MAPEVEVPVSQGNNTGYGWATFRAFEKLTLLPEDAYQNREMLVDYYNKLYADFGERHSLEYSYIQPPMSKEFGPIQLHYAFRKAYKASEPCMGLLKQYKLVDYNLPQAGVVRAMMTGEENSAYRVRGLYLTGRIAERQVEEAKKVIAKFNKANAGLKAVVFDPVGYIILDAIRLELGLLALDRSMMAVRFIDMPERLVYGATYVPIAFWNSNGLGFGASHARTYGGRIGVRFSVEKTA